MIIQIDLGSRIQTSHKNTKHYHKGRYEQWDMNGVNG
jgi:hypothetical protein